MPKIQQLPIAEIQKIAAGEVVERPANVVKELVENALDAGATRLTVIIEDGGKKSIRVIDNGYGMDAADARACFEHHATSKIQTVDDLQLLMTYGFRGEALSSIASVSKITLVTKETNAAQATKLFLEANTVVQESSVSANTGTDITVEDLFFNVPARQKFLKTRETEWRQILHFMQSVVFAYPAVHIELIADGQSMLNCPANNSLNARCAQLWDYTVAQQMISLSIDDEARHIAVDGIISRQQYARYDRSGIFLFVNKRWVKNNHLIKALLKGYLNSLPPARFPAAALFITIDPLQVDVNIHPRKEEVKLLHPQVVDGLVFKGVKQALEQQLSKSASLHSQSAVVLPDEPFMPENHSSFHMPQEPVCTLVKKFEQVAYVPEYVGSCAMPIIPERKNETALVQPALSEKNEQREDAQQQLITPTISPELPLFSVIGQYNKTYIMVQQGTELLIIDQHAAHERILYELFATRFDDVAVVKLLFPLLITVSREQAELAEQHASLFEAHGLHIERFGEQQVRLLASPVHLQEKAPQELIKQIIGWLQEFESVSAEQLYDLLNEKIRAKMACVAAVKAGDELAHEQMKQLIADLFKTGNRITCPHGRPTSWSIELVEMEKKFKRDYRSMPREDSEEPKLY